MSHREQFGHYLLLKKLTEDPLGETFRARLLSGPQADRTVLLRVLNGEGVDAERLWEACHDRQGVQNVLRVPNIAEGLDLGQFEGIPYGAWDYVSGKNLAQVLEQAARRQQLVSAEHALLISERLALALATAYENRYQGQRILHGFLAPHLAMISSEGETRLLGFEIAPGFRANTSHPVIRRHFGRYLAPEVLAGAARDTKDDVFSLGVILYELLTGQPLASAGPEGYGAVIEGARLATDGNEIPEDLRHLLRQSLAPRPERPADVVAWHKMISNWMFQGGYNPTTFNLAFFMHSLFDEEIAQEGEEIEFEKTMPIPVIQPQDQVLAADESTADIPAAGVPAAGVPAAGGPAAGGPAAGVPVAEAGGVGETTGTVITAHIPERRSNTGLIVGLAAAVVVLSAAAGYFWWSSRSAPPAPTVAQIPPPAPAPIPAGPTEEELEAQQEALQEKIANLVDQQTSSFEDQVRTQYEGQLAELRKQLEETKAAAERRRLLEAELLAQQEQTEAESTAGIPETSEATVADNAGAADEGIPTDEGESVEGEPKAELEIAEVSPPPAAPPPPAAAPPPPVAAPPPPPAAPRPPQVRRGDLVEMGPGVSAPVPLSLAPRFPEPARRINKRQATVTVKVLVDENGKPLEAKLVGQKVGFGFDQEALNAVKRTNYRPATKSGVPVKVWYTFKVQFKN